MGLLGSFILEGCSTMSKEAGLSVRYDMDVVRLRVKFPVFKKRTRDLDIVSLMRLALEKVVKSFYDPHGHMFVHIPRDLLHLRLPGFLHDEHLVYVAERVSKLHSISLPMSMITGKGFSKGCSHLRELETISMESITTLISYKSWELIVQS